MLPTIEVMYKALQQLAGGKRKLDEIVEQIEANDEKTPDGMYGRYWVVGAKPNMTFRVPWKSEKYMQIMGMSQEECNSLKPHMRGLAEPYLFIKGKLGKELLEEVTLAFSPRGEFETDDLEIARVAQQAARLTRRKGDGNIFRQYDYLHRHSKPIPPLESDKKNQKVTLKPKTA